MRLSPTSPLGASALGRLAGPAWLEERRRSAWGRFLEAEAPSESEEIWRYSRIDDLELERYRPLAELPAPRSLAQLPSQLAELVASLGEGATVVASANGAVAEVVNPQEGLEVACLSVGAGPAYEEVPERPLELGGPPADLFVELNEALAPSPWRVRVAPGAALAHPVVLVHWLEGEGAAFFPRLEVQLGRGARAEVLEVLAGSGGDMLVVPYVELKLAREARLGFGHVQLLGSGAWEVGNQLSRLGAAAVLRSMTFALGGYYARARSDSVLEGEGGDSELLAAYFGTGDQMHDLRTVQHHAAPNTRSDLLFKGAVADESRSVYSGLIRVEKGARGTNAFQTNRNLVLSGGARAYSVPNLEIEDNDVRCSHASAVGPVDEGQLFYLESRGVPTPAAVRLIVLGFLDDVLQRFPVPGALGWLRGELASKFASAGLPR